MSGSGQQKRGYALLVVLAMFLIVAIVMAALLSSLSEQRSRVLAGENGLQSRCLAEAGAERAAAILQTQPDYPGEEWQVSPRLLGHGTWSGLVSIRAVPIADHELQRRVHVIAVYPDDEIRQARTEKVVIVTLPADPQSIHDASQENGQP